MSGPNEEVIEDEAQPVEPVVREGDDTAYVDTWYRALKAWGPADPAADAEGRDDATDPAIEA